MIHCKFSASQHSTYIAISHCLHLEYLAPFGCLVKGLVHSLQQGEDLTWFSDRAPGSESLKVKQAQREILVVNNLIQDIQIPEHSEIDKESAGIPSSFTNIT